jgi:hypothetical protein
LLVDAGILVERLHARDSVRYEFAPGGHNGQSALATQIEILHPDGTRTVTSDPRLDALVLELCQTAGVQARKRTLLIDCGS